MISDRMPSGAAAIRRRDAQLRRDGLHRERPGESKQADIGISLPGTGEAPPRRVHGRKEDDNSARPEHCR
jgi:hypothetical protein